MATYYEVKTVSGEEDRRWVDTMHGLLPESAFDEGEMEGNSEVLTGRTVEIDDSFTVIGTPGDWMAELQRRCREAVETQGVIV